MHRAFAPCGDAQQTRISEHDLHASRSKSTALKLGGTSIVTDPFELFVAYADRIRAGSGNPNTMVVQLTNGYEGYLPTAKAISCGGYSAGVNNGYLGAEGGDALVRESLWKSLRTYKNRGV